MAPLILYCISAFTILLLYYFYKSSDDDESVRLKKSKNDSMIDVKLNIHHLSKLNTSKEDDCDDDVFECKR